MYNVNYTDVGEPSSHEEAIAGANTDTWLVSGQAQLGPDGLNKSRIGLDEDRSTRPRSERHIGVH